MECTPITYFIWSECISEPRINKFICLPLTNCIENFNNEVAVSTFIINWNKSYGSLNGGYILYYFLTWKVKRPLYCSHQSPFRTL